MIPDGRTPVFVVTGFLGSGKTTLLNRLVATPRFLDSLVVVNEFGEIPVDHHLLQSSEEKTVALPNGCLCCHLRGDLEETLIGAAMRRRRGEIAGFDRVIVETSGLADPGPVAQTLYADRALERDFKLGPIVTVVDAADRDNRNLSLDIAKSQIAAADVIVLSKTDRVADFSPLEKEIQTLNPQARRIAARFGNVDPAVLENVLEKSGTDHVFSPVAHHDRGINTFHLKFDRPPRKDLLERFLALLVELRGADLLRVKGIVALEGGELVAVQGVRHVFDRLRPIAGRPSTGLVFITHNMAERDVLALWQAMSSLKGSS
ncbi:MAG: CobW family GTP-binding protein [Burkholderiales bacterium]